MDTPKDILLHKLLHKEWRAGHNESKALANIHARLGSNSIDEHTLSTSFQQFENGDCLNASNSVVPEHSFDSFLDTSQSALFSTNDSLAFQNVNDGRLSITASYEVKREWTFALFDLMHGLKKVFSIQNPSIAALDSIGSIVLLDDLHFLVARPGLRRLFLLRIDYEARKVDVLDSVALGIESLLGELILDDADSSKFILSINRTSSFIAGKIEKMRIVLSPKQQLAGLQRLKYKKLNGRTLSGLKIEQEAWNFYEFDLEALNHQSIEIPALSDNNQQVNLRVDSPFVWSGSRLYIARLFYNSYTKVFAFDVNSRTWSYTGICVTDLVTRLHVDSNEILTLQTYNDFSRRMTAYRVALKKQDSLKMLAWRTILRNGKLFGSEMYAKIADRLPYNSELRCLFESEPIASD